LRLSGRLFYLVPDDPRIHGVVALVVGAGRAPEGHAVVVEITRYPSAPGEPLAGRVAHVLGPPDDPRTEVEKVIICADIPNEFADEAQMAAARAPREVRPVDLADRADLRDRGFLTCDPETARDFDDAVCVEERPDGWWLWVAVADVSHYVAPGGALDREARTRGCSVYLPDRAIPMLPHELSAGICSLNPEVDRLAMVCRLHVGRDGAVHDCMLCAGVIRSRARLDYAGVAAALAGDFRGPRARYRDYMPALTRMAECARVLRKQRDQRGSLDLNLEQAMVVLDQDDPRRVRDVRRSRSSEGVRHAYGMIEDFMLAANEGVAAFFRERQLDAVWRVHDKPDEARLEEFALAARAYGISVETDGAVDPRQLRKVALALRDRPYERPLSYLMLRSLKQATYDVVNIGHFGLAAKEYVHFTSPIRRYPDLLVHRLLKRQLHAEGMPAGTSADARADGAMPRAVLAELALESSTHERRAMAAEREVVDMYRAYLMRERVGEELDGTVSGVTRFGVFVQVDEPYIEGMVRMAALAEEGFELDESALRLVARRTGRVLALGDRVRVRIEEVSVPRRRIEMALCGGGHRAADDRPLFEPPRRKGRGRAERKRKQAEHDRDRRGRDKRRR
jgi:ribonuclease R